MASSADVAAWTQHAGDPQYLAGWQVNASGNDSNAGAVAYEIYGQHPLPKGRES